MNLDNHFIPEHLIALEHLMVLEHLKVLEHLMTLEHMIYEHHMVLNISLALKHFEGLLTLHEYSTPNNP